MQNNIEKELVKKSFLPKLSIKLLLVATLFIGSLFLFAFITDEIIFQKRRLFDDSVIDYFSQFNSPGFISVMRGFTFFGSPTFLLPAYFILVLYFAITRNWRYSINIAIVGITSTLLMFGLKQVFRRDRPDFSLIKSLKTYSFPSGHSLSSFIFCSILIYLIWHRDIKTVWKWVLSVFLLLISATIGISRIVLGLHYPTDVVAGFCLGFVWVTLSFWILRKIDFSNVFKGRKGV